MTARLPIPGSDNGTWGDILNAFLGVSLAADGTLKPNIVGNAQLDTATQNSIAAVADKVSMSGDQTVAGIKTFSSSPVVPNATASTQAATFGQVQCLPANIVGANNYDPALSAYNLKASLLAKTRNGLGKGLAGVTPVSGQSSSGGSGRIVWVGDSTTAGLFSNGNSASGGLPATQSPPAYLKALLKAAGCTINGTGFVCCAQHTLTDARWTYGSGFASYAGTLGGGIRATTSGAVATFNTATTSETGTDLTFAYYNNGGSMTYNVDSTGDHTVSGGGFQTVTITGLANTTHSIVFTTLAGTTQMNLLGCELYSNAGVSISNPAIPGSSTASWLLNSNAQFNTNTIQSYAAVSGKNIDLTLIELGINDVNQGVSVSTYQSNMTTIVGYYKALGDVILVTPNIPNPTALNTNNVAFGTIWNNYVQALFNVADSTNVPLINLGERVNYAALNLAGLAYDNVHLYAGGYAMKARHIHDVLRSVA